jgi:hypothetical protein
MEVVSINSKRKENIIEEEQKKSMLDVIKEMQRQIESGEIKEFVACSLDADGIAQIHVSILDLPGGVGLFEIGKHQLIDYETSID